MANEDLVVAKFRMHAIPNDAKSRAAGRLIVDDMEVVEIRFSANRQTVAVFPAHEVFKWRTDPLTGMREPWTYAMEYPEQYRKFKAGEAQAQSGTPLAELPFLSEGKRLELKALNIHTAEALASIDGVPLRNMGMGGRELKNQAQAYLDNATGSAAVVRMAAENEALKQNYAVLQQQVAELLAAAKKPETKALEDCTDAELKAYIKAQTGEMPRGNPSHETLYNLAMELATTPEAA